MWDLINEPDGRGFVDASSGWKPDYLIGLKNIYYYPKSRINQPITVGVLYNVKRITDLFMDPIFTGLIPQYHEYSAFDGSDSDAFKEKNKNLHKCSLRRLQKKLFLIGEFGLPGNLDKSVKTYYDMGWTGEHSTREN